MESANHSQASRTNLHSLAVEISELESAEKGSAVYVKRHNFGPFFLCKTGELSNIISAKKAALDIAKASC